MTKMTMEKLENIFNQIIDNCSMSDAVKIHNVFCEETNDDTIIYQNNEDNINSLFDNTYKFLQSVSFEDYNIDDNYMWFDEYANLESSNYEDDTPIDKSLWFDHFKDNWSSIKEYADLSDYELAYSYFENDEEYDEDDFAEYDID